MINAKDNIDKCPKVWMMSIEICYTTFYLMFLTRGMLLLHYAMVVITSCPQAKNIPEEVAIVFEKGVE